MAVFSGPDISENDLVLALDAANPRNYNLTEVEVLVVAGGGSGGYGEVNPNGGGGGGGGAGGLIYNSNFSVVPGTTLTVTVGNGGAAPSNAGSTGSNGGNSVFGSLTAIGGGAGGGGDFEGTNAGATGGSGGGAGGDGTYGPTIFSSGTAGQGFAGGARNGSTNRAAAGGGGAASAGSSAVAQTNGTGKGGDGGSGLGYNISGTFTYYAGGGGGGASFNFSSGVVNSVGGIGGGGSGGGATTATNGTANTGGGGGGGFNATVGAGGSGIVIVRYPGPQKAIGGAVTSVGGYTIHTFATVGSATFTPLVATNNSAISGLSDLSGRGNFATATNGPTYNSSNGGSIVFDGSNDYVELNTNNIISGTNPFTFEAFYKVTNDSVNAELFGNYGSGYTSNTIWISGRFGVYINTSVPYFQGYPLSLGTYHMAFTRTSGGVCTLYKNGIVDGTATSTTSISSSQNFRIGSDVNGIAEVFGGELYSLKVYNRVLTATEIQQNFNATRGRYGI